MSACEVHHTRELERVRRSLVAAIEGRDVGQREEDGSAARRVGLKPNLTW
jgi:hypothetical protein